MTAERARAAADVEHARPAEVAFADEQLDELGVIPLPQLVVARRELGEVDVIRDGVVGVRHPGEELLGVLEPGLRHENGDRVGLVDRLQLGLDVRFGEHRLDLFRLGDVVGGGQVNHLRHCGLDDTDSGWSCLAPPFTSCGVPRSAKGIWMTSKSRGTTVSGNTSRASRAVSAPK